MKLNYALTGQVLKKYRGELTQAELAKKLKVHIQFVSNWERGQCMPPKHAMKVIFKEIKEKNELALLAEAYRSDAWNKLEKSMKSKAVKNV